MVRVIILVVVHTGCLAAFFPSGQLIQYSCVFYITSFGISVELYVPLHRGTKLGPLEYNRWILSDVTVIINALP